jgi:transcriptional regulator with XRE-family HTH domain
VADPRIGRSRLPEWIKAKGWTQAEFSRRMKMSNVMTTKIINGDRVFSLTRARQASKLLGCTIEDLYDWKD